MVVSLKRSRKKFAGENSFTHAPLLCLLSDHLTFQHCGGTRNKLGQMLLDPAPSLWKEESLGYTLSKGGRNLYPRNSMP